MESHRCASRCSLRAFIPVLLLCCSVAEGATALEQAQKQGRHRKQRSVTMSMSESGLVRRHHARRQKHDLTPDVTCDTTRGKLRIKLNPDGAPQGVRRFLDMVRDGFVKDQAIFRAMRNFIAQFGISGEQLMNEKWASTIPDDAQTVRPPFPKGTVSFAGNGENSRNTQLFITLGDMSESLGTRPWEVPIGHVYEEDLGVLDQFFVGYGESIDQEELLSKGNAWAKEYYPRLDYIKECSLINDPLHAYLVDDDSEW
eukprot:gb/GFBE01003268.1/.p1 GENE.gb/GFBE01003268.1/~~gb/GFBE01003268.1/.p1  ORF type:complete len:256 (+),score=47.06 gb/GFBE01003268.1/:1-768(+)